MSGELPRELPPVHEGVLDEPTLDALVDDLDALTHVLRVRVKGAPDERAEPGELGLREAVARLRSGGVRAVQIHYRHEGSEWLDTVMARATGYAVVRIEVPAER